VAGNLGARVVDLGQRITSSDGYRIEQEFDRLELSRRTFLVNLQELVSAVELFERPELIAIWAVDK
jgi:hypothetical protein